MTRRHLLGIALAVLALMVFFRAQHLQAIAAAPPADVLIAYDPAALPAESARVRWEPLLEQQSIPHEWVPLRDFGILDGAALAHRFHLIVVPHRLNRRITDAARAQFSEFVAAGGILYTSRDPAALKALLARAQVANHQ